MKKISSGTKMSISHRYVFSIVLFQHVLRIKSNISKSWVRGIIVLRKKNKTSPHFVFYKQNQELVSQSIFFFLARHKSKLFSQPFCHSWSIGNEFCLTTYKYQGSKIWISYDTFIKTNQSKYESVRRYKKDK